MAVSLVKLGLVVGAGICGSLLVKEGPLSNVTDLVSGAFKIVFKQLNKGDPAVRPHTDNLMQQVDGLRQQLQSLNVDSQMYIVTGNGSGSSKYGTVVIVVAGCGGYIWWKGFKLPDMMFATKRSLSDACNAVAKQLDDFYSTLRLTRRELSSQIDTVGAQVNEVTDITINTNRMVNELHQDITEADRSVQLVQSTVLNLRSKIERIEGKQDAMNRGVLHLVGVAQKMENNRVSIQAQSLPPSPSQAYQRRQLGSSLQHANLLPAPPMSPEPSMSSLESDEIQQSVKVMPLPPRHQEHGVTSEAGYSSQSRITEVSTSESSGSGRFGKMFSGFGGVMRTRSAIVTRPIVVKQAGLGGALNQA